MSYWDIVKHSYTKARTYTSTRALMYTLSQIIYNTEMISLIVFVRVRVCLSFYMHVCMYVRIRLWIYIFICIFLSIYVCNVFVQSPEYRFTAISGLAKLLQKIFTQRNSKEKLWHLKLQKYINHIFRTIYLFNKI